MLGEKELAELRERDFFSKESNFKKNEQIKSKLIYGDLSSKVPFVTLIIPTYKREETLKQTIKSILLQEDFDDYEILIVDNEDVFDRVTKTEEIIKSFNSEKIIYYRNEKNIGMYGNWNRCIELSRSKWICMVHDDDALAKNHLSTMTNIIKKNKNIDYLACTHNHIDERQLGAVDLNYYSEKVNINKKQIKYKGFRDFNLGFNAMFLGAIFNRDKAIEIGGFVADRAWVEDYLFVAKYAYYFNLYKLEVPLYIYRWADNQSLKSNIWEDQLVYEYYLFRYIASKRTILKGTYTILSKYITLNRMNSYIRGDGFFKTKCNINKNNVYKMCNMSNPNINPFLLIISKGIRRMDYFIRDLYYFVIKNKKIL